MVNIIMIKVMVNVDSQHYHDQGDGQHYHDHDQGNGQHYHDCDKGDDQNYVAQ